jgi:hypothetical protein
LKTTLEQKQQNINIVDQFFKILEKIKIPVVRQMILIWRTADRPPGQRLIITWRPAVWQMT